MGARGRWFETSRQKAAKRRERLSGTYLAAFDRALHWAEIGRIGAAAGDGSKQVSDRSAGTWLDQAIIETPGR